MLPEAMLFHTNFILLLLTSLPYTFGSPQANTTDKRTGCHQSDSLYTFIPTRIRSEPEFDFGIRTSYTTYYPKALKNALLLDNFHPYVLSNNDQCGWKKARSVSAGGHRGDVY
jgi:hypothetical protein